LQRNKPIHVNGSIRALIYFEKCRDGKKRKDDMDAPGERMMTEPGQGDNALELWLMWRK
jgi:hypothetical protein